MVRKQNDGFRLHHLEKSKRGLQAVVVGAGFGRVDKGNQLVGAWPPSPHLNQYQASWPVGAIVLQFLLFTIKFFGCSEPAIGKTEAVDGDCHIWDWHQIQLKYSLSINVEWKWSMGLNFHYRCTTPHPPLILTHQDSSDLKSETLSKQARCIDEYNSNWRSLAQSLVLCDTHDQSPTMSGNVLN